MAEVDSGLDAGLADVPGVGPVFGVPEAKKAQPKSREEFEGLSPGSQYLDPEGLTRIKPYAPKTLEAFKDVPEGAQYLDPEGNLREKPVYKGVGFTAEMLHDMALTDDTKRQALEKVFPGKVKDGPDGPYVDDNGVLRRPGRGGVLSQLGTAAAATAPAAGMLGGGILGGSGGTLVEPIGGTAAGAAGGAILGAMAGRQFNNIVLGLAGIHEHLDEQIKSMGWEGAGVAGGELVGKGLSKIPGVAGAAKRAVGATGKKLGGIRENLPDFLESIGVTPKRARDFIGTKSDTLEQASQIATKAQNLGLKSPVAPSTFAHESPMLRKIEEFDAVFRAQNVFGEAARDFYEAQGRDLLEHPEIGITVSGLLTRAEQKVSSEHAGKLALHEARLDMAFKDATLEKAQRDARFNVGADDIQLAGQKGLRDEHMEELVRAQKDAADTARKFVDTAIDDLHADTGKALKELKSDEQPGALWRMTGARFQAYNQAIKTRARMLYDVSDRAGGDLPLPGSGSKLGGDAADFLDRLPEVVRSKYPAEIKAIARLAGKAAKEGEEAVPPTDLAFKDIRMLRSWLRHGIDYTDLTPDMRAGALRHFERKVNGFLHDQKLPDQFKHAAQMLDEADAFYKDKVPYLHDQMVKTVMQGLESGVPANPDVLAKVLFDPNRLEAMRKARGIVGEPLWKYAQAAHAKDIIDNARTLVPGEINGKRFADQIESMVQSGLLQAGYDKPLADRLLGLARNVRQLEGALPVKVTDTDTLSSLMRKANEGAEEIKAFADKDPMKALSAEMKRIDTQFQKNVKLAKSDRRSEALGFLYEDSMSAMAARAADRILGSQDLIAAAAQKFGRESSEFKALQQVYVHRFLQRSLGDTGKMFSQLGGEKGMTEEVQALMFPGVTRHAMVQLAKDMEFLFSSGGSDVGASMAAGSRVLNAQAHIPIPKHGPMGQIILGLPLIGTASRYALGKFYATVVDGVSHPNFINWLASGIAKGGAERQAARMILQKRLALGGWIGAEAGAYEAERNK